MAYTPTDWNDDAAPAINASNLDKIEQGIADAHTTADAAIAKAILDAAGDLVSASAADTPARLAKCSDDEVLSVNSGALDYRKVVNAMVGDAAAIAYSKLNLASSIVNADIGAAAAIAYSKLNLASSIVNADIGAAAAIAYSKLNLASSIVNADISGSAAIAYSKLALTNEIVNADIDDAAAIAYSKLALTGSLVAADAAFTFTSFTPVLRQNATEETSTDNGSAYLRLGELVICYFNVTCTSTGDGNNIITIDVPDSLTASVRQEGCGSALVVDNATAGYT